MLAPDYPLAKDRSRTSAYYGRPPAGIRRTWICAAECDKGPPVLAPMVEKAEDEI